MIFKVTQPDYIFGLILGMVLGVAISAIAYLATYRRPPCPTIIELRGTDTVTCQAESFQDVIEGKVPCLS